MRTISSMIPAGFHSAQYVLPQIVLDGAGDSHHFVREHLASSRIHETSATCFAVSCILTTSMEAQLLSCLERGIHSCRIRVSRGAAGEGLLADASVVIGRAELQASDRSRNRATDVPAGLVSASAAIETVDHASIQGGPFQESEAGRSLEGDRAHVGLVRF